MANQNKLKAYVRYDGTGRVIAGGPILQRFKPKVGNWVEIDAKECCNDITTTTTTSTTTTTTTAYPGSYYNADSGSQAACNQSGAYSLPLTFLPETVCFGGDVTLAVGTWATYGVPTNGSSIYVNIGTGSVVQLIPNGTTTSANIGCTSCA